MSANSRKSSNNSMVQSVLGESKTIQRVHAKPAVEKSLNEWVKYRIADRSEWWKCQIKPYPPPGQYSQPTFIEILASNPVKTTYGFLNEGRKKEISAVGNGESLLPGGYEYQDLGLLIKKKPSHSFKLAPRRSECFSRGKTDLYYNLSPGQYETHHYLSISAPKGSDKMMVFRSKVERFPSKPFEPKLGPGPGAYDVVCPIVARPITSSFKSSSARFKASTTKSPGPGSYDKTYESPSPPEMKNMGQQHGLFFNSAFCN